MGNRYEFIAPCHFGLEAVCKREIADLGYEIGRWKGNVCRRYGSLSKSEYLLENNPANSFKSGRI